jgi:predicted ATPase
MVVQTKGRIKKEVETKKYEEEPTKRTREKLTGREAIMAVLARAADETEFLARLADNPAEALREYYTLTKEELAALASGDIRKIESWCGKLDKRHATWLWCRLSQEKW